MRLKDWRVKRWTWILEPLGRGAIFVMMAGALFLAGWFRYQYDRKLAYNQARKAIEDDRAGRGEKR